MMPPPACCSSLVRIAVLFAVLLGGAVGCKRKAVETPPPKPPIIPVSRLVEREVADFADYTGRTDAVQSVSIRARVTGFLMKMPFEEGAEVQEGDLLFEIDPRPYQALVDQAQSQVVLNQASYNLAKTIYDRDNSPRAAGVVSQLQLDTQVGMSGLERQHTRRDMTAPEHDRCGDPDRAAQGSLHRRLHSVRIKLQHRAGP